MDLNLLASLETQGHFDKAPQALLLARLVLVRRRPDARVQLSVARALREEALLRLEVAVEVVLARLEVVKYQDTRFENYGDSQVRSNQT